MIPQARFAALADISFYEISVALLLIGAALVCTFTTSRLLAVSALGVVGFMTTLVFMLYSAPDVAKTLLLVETLMVVFVVLLIRHIPGLLTVPQHSVTSKITAWGDSGCDWYVGNGVVDKHHRKPLDSTLADFFAENSVPGGHGRNIVNVILVDFRAFDTLGEVIVVVMAGIAAVSLLKTHYHNATASVPLSCDYRTHRCSADVGVLTLSFYSEVTTSRVAALLVR
ncbi:hydrogen gas-evolving membrane-bound hydrogenase subunit E [Vibrio owensii]|uniref:hydrogen gas-evolving membrane-bound hydrogenase subunit E n=1 Tax=Vibrio owensii TaxID=696485 RepID=UPI001E5BAFE9|nr:hydrogen gas-evolving membrane-bound hydrogenase subunit E [Vibrio owensii]